VTGSVAKQRFDFALVQRFIEVCGDGKLRARGREELTTTQIRHPDPPEQVEGRNQAWRNRCGDDRRRQRAKEYCNYRTRVKFSSFTIKQDPSSMALSPSPEPGQNSMGASDAASPDRFEAALAELEGIVQKMESGSLSLEQSLAAYRRGAELVGAARKALADVEQQVRILEADVLKPFDAGQDEEA